MKRFREKVCVVTGATNGIGYQIALDFAKEGATVYNLDIEAPSHIETGFLDALLTDIYHHEVEIPNKSLKIRYIACDLRKEAEIESAIRQIIDEVGEVDYLINNACYSNKGLISGCDFEKFNDVLKVGVTAPYLLTKGFMPVFKSGASIVNIASTRGYMSQRDTESYSAAKGGILSLTHAMSISLSGKVRVNAISPGWIDTTKGQFSVEDQHQHPAGRIGKPKDISRLVRFLCSREAGFITGENITVDGGMTKQMIYHGDEGWSYSEE